MLSTTCKYAVRALVELSRLPQGERALGCDLATHAGLPPNYLSKILVSLGQAGFVEACRGSRGGYRLRRRPDRLTLLEIVESLHGPQRAFRCLLRPGQPCSASDPCSAHRDWARLHNLYLTYLADTSIADLARRPEGSGSRAADPALDRSAKTEEMRD